MSNYRTAFYLKAKSLKARERVNKRWAMIRAKQAAIEAANPISFGDALVCRVIVMARGQAPVEVCAYAFDSFTVARRKQRAVVAAMRKGYTAAE